MPIVPISPSTFTYSWLFANLVAMPRIPIRGAGLKAVFAATFTELTNNCLANIIQAEKKSTQEARDWRLMHHSSSSSQSAQRSECHVACVYVPIIL